MPKDCVDVKAYNAQNTLIFHQIYSTANWYQELHPIIDSNDFRVRYHVAKIEGAQYDDQGTETRWVLFYAVDGSIVERSAASEPS